MTTNIYDLQATAVGVGSGKLSSPESYPAMVSTNLRGHPTAAPPSRRTCPSKKLAIAVAVTYQPEVFDDRGEHRNEAETLFRRIGAVLAPDDVPPVPTACWWSRS